MYLILLGAPGAGKGTQATTLSKELGLAHISSGDLFRENLSQKTELGILAKSYMDKGALVPDDVTIKMIFQRLAKPDSAKGAILDGFPRTLEQAKALDEAFAAQGKSVTKALYIKVANDELLRRLGGRWICRNCQAPFHIVSNPPKVEGKCDLCGGELYQRADDNMETAKNRLDVYFSQTAPLIDYYRGKGVLVETDGEQSVEEVGVDLIAATRK